MATQGVDLNIPSYKGWREILSVDGTKPAKVMTVYSVDPIEALYEPVMLGSGDLLISRAVQ